MITRIQLMIALLVLANAGCTRTSSIDPPADAVKSSSKTTAEDEGSRVIRGRVIHANGAPAVDIRVATFWGANGRQWDENDVFPENKTAADTAEFWNDEGEMASYPALRAKLLSHGRFEIEKSNRKPYMVFAMNDDQTHGGLALATPDSENELCITLEPLTRVFGKIRCNDDIPGFTYACFFGHLKQAPD